MPDLRAGQPVILVHRKITGTDEFGNDVYTATQQIINGCAVSPGNSTESFQGTEAIISDIVVHVPPSTEIELPLDQVIIGSEVYNVIGIPKQWSSPFTGTPSMTEINCKLITTGGPAK
jgi:hypothetical protein